MRLFADGPSTARYGLTILRIVTGLVFLVHGWQKFFTMGMAGVTAFFTQLGIPAPGIAAPFVSALELVGGALLILGFFARPIALLLAIDMLVAILTVHLSKGFSAANGGYEFVLLLLAACLAIVLAGAGSPSVDRNDRAQKYVRTASTICRLSVFAMPT